MIYWLDLETTGLSPENDQILEIAVARATEAEPTKLEGIFDRPIRMVREQELSPFITNMHIKNGLLRDVADFGIPLVKAEDRLLELIPEGKHTLAGSSVHFDASFLRVHMPYLYERFSHRMLDVSAIKLFCGLIGTIPLPKAEAHRARADVEESARHLAMCMSDVGLR